MSTTLDALLSNDNLETIRLHAAFKTAFGTASSLGLIIVQLPANHPFHAQRHRLLALAPKVAALPSTTKSSLEHPESKYSFGWSHGKELMGGIPDVRKASFYALIHERTDISPEFTAKYPSYGFRNIWPDESSLGGESLRDAFTDLGKTISETGVLLAKRLDEYLRVSGSAEMTCSIEAALASNQNCSKGRLLYYYPGNKDTAAMDNAAESPLGSWCGLHLDHSLLTGLTRAVTNPPVLSDSDDSGLYIQQANGEFTRVCIPEDCIAFQIGEAAMLLSGGILRATPHLVKASSKHFNVERSTFACFLQPDPDFVLTAKDGKTFGEFSEDILLHHY
ncbi:hypothetical protein BDR26DRAFT_850218 [Obelidium mucronatum]|nr:hypothetical protein BDR26DRAFT_850218 [Obelidium mucronatum]